jgi:holo-[acyl-carrier protein] synthase
MVVGLGVDIVEIDRVENALRRWGLRLVQKLMDPGEAALLPEPSGERALALAHAVAAKEAASKSIGTGWTRGVRWRDVVVDRNAPALELRARAREFAARLGSEGAGELRFERHGNLLVAEFRLFA